MYFCIFCIPTWIYFDSYLYTVDNIDWPGESTGSTVSDGHWTLSGWIFRTHFFLWSSAYLEVTSLPSGKTKKQQSKSQNRHFVFSQNWLTPEMSSPSCSKRVFYQFHAFRGHFKTSSMHWASCWNATSLDGLLLFVSRRFEEWKSCSGWHKYWCVELAWLNNIICKHRLKEWCSIRLESMQIRKHWINSI